MQDMCDALLQRLDALESENQRLDAFAHAVAHQLKGPLYHIAGYARFLRDVHATLPDAKLRESLEMMRCQAHKMLAIVDELLLCAGADRETALLPLAEAKRAPEDAHAVELVLDGMLQACALTGVDKKPERGAIPATT